MAEQEVIKHTKQIYKIWTSKSHSFWQKLKEFFIEIIIIVFAVTLSIRLHDRSEYGHQQKEVKEFMLGLRQDLLSDLNEMNFDTQSYLEQQHIFSYISSAGTRTSLSADSLKKFQHKIFNTTRLQQNNGRFEGFKASGKIGAIEDEKLQNDIMDLYQENIPLLLGSIDYYISRKSQLLDFIIKNWQRVNDSTSNFSAILHSYEAQNICLFLAHPEEIISRYDLCKSKMQTIVGEIERDYSLEPKK